MILLFSYHEYFVHCLYIKKTDIYFLKKQKLLKIDEL